MSTPSISQDGYIPELEQEVLGTLLSSGNLKLVSGTLRPEHFVENLHRRIFERMQEADSAYGNAGLPVVYKLFSKEEQDAVKGRLGIGLSEYLARLVGGCVRGVPGLRTSIQAMLQQWARISLGNQAAVVQAAAADPATHPAELIRSLGRTLDDIGAALRTGKRSKTRFTMAEASEAAVTAIEDARTQGNGLTGITWGLADVDRATGGLQRGEMTVLGARPAMGKTAIGLGVGIKAAAAGVGVGFISLEMGARTLAMRALSDIAFDRFGRVEYSDLMAGRVNDASMEHVYAAQAVLSGLPLQIEDASGLAINDIRVKFERMAEIAERAGTPIEVLMVDYLQLVAASSRYQGNRTHEITEISAALRNMAREYNVALLALSQLSRQVETREDKRPMLSDLRESGSIEQDADTVIFLYRESYYLAREKAKTADDEFERSDKLLECQNRLEFIIAKQRNGPTRTVDLFVDIACSAVRNAARS
ncbi:DnaB-like helicase C-terminal domain-containing protein [Rhizobium calliandrae]|uniref:DNA 5'-3' helicase n=1 Tax=Rhizobium calliandrae TaxID=1312182 RepID=A0ABT7KLA1_9HYPH|nr:DnaB-like helicase C-terminal domain-containing protein [Rhizobium calliandrae]MDL2408738.1 DnaB-like helicase C-terminal domain-containing protein [Rhizobium calliandrae]